MFKSQRPDSRAFHELLEVMRAYEKKFLRRRFLKGDLEYAAGYRSLLDLLATGMECFVHNSPERPRFVHVVSPDRKVGGDNADALYPFAPLAKGRSYRVRGTMGSAIYVGFTLYGGADNERFHLVGNLSTPDLHVDAQGRFEVSLGPAALASGGNHLRTDDTTRCLIMRRYFLNRGEKERDPGNQEIDALDPPPPAERTGEEMERQLRALSSFLKGWLNLTPIPMPPLPFAYNRLTKPRPASTDTGHWSTPDNQHAFGLFRLKDDQALVIRGRAPECTYWSVHLWNPYLQTLDYVNHPAALNGSQVVLEADGSFELCVAHRNPGHANWISTTGRGRGMIYFRFLKATSAIEPLRTSVVATFKLRAQGHAGAATATEAC